LYVYLGADIGCAMIGQGQLCTGATGNSGDIAHITVDPDGPACACGGHGCLSS